MMTLAPIRSAQHAVSYFERSDHADYYLREDVCPSVWMGRGAEILGIEGQAVDPERFKRYLNGHIAGETIGTKRNGEAQHKPGWDLQFSPPKSASVMALVAGDRRIIAAHDKAVADAISFLESRAAYTRIHSRDESGKDVVGQVNTGNLICAAFRHDTSRLQDPQLHSHAVVLNATQRADGGWRSLESRHFYSLQKEVGLHYRQCLAASLREMGYSIERAANANFEISGIPDDVLSAFSQRRDLIDKKLEELGYTRENSPAELKEKISHETREKKVHVAPEMLREQWLTTAKEHQFDIFMVARQSIEKCQSPEWEDSNRLQLYEESHKLIDRVIDSLSERDSVFSKDLLRNEANKLAVGYGISAKQIDSVITGAELDGRLVGDRVTKVYIPQFQNWQEVEAYTTPENIRIEEEMIVALRTGKSSLYSEYSKHEIEKIIDFAEKDSIDKGFDGWNAGQKTVTRGLLTSTHQIVGVQGYAGTAKTSTVLRTVAKEYAFKGYILTGMAPSSSACKSLEQGADIKNVVTVASHLLSRDNSHINKKQLWLVDEASLLSTKDTQKLLAKAKYEDAKVILVGDVKQLGSVEAGAAFRQLQENGMSTFELDVIVRQENQKTLDAIYSSIEGDAGRAIDILADGGGHIVESPGDISNRHLHIVDRYLSLTPEERQKTLLVDPSREGRDELTRVLRATLRIKGELVEQESQFCRLEKLDLTKSGSKDVMNYESGDKIRFGRTYKSKDVEKNSYWEVTKRDPNTNTLVLLSGNGKELIWNPEAWGSKSQVFRTVESGLSVGDKIVWTLNNREKELSNGMKGVVKSIDEEGGRVDVQLSNGKQVILSIDSLAHQHWNHDYVTTAHAAQGLTADRVIYHAESFRRNLLNQKSFYVAISRAKHEAIVVTDNRQKLVEQIKEHAGDKQAAIEMQRSNQYELE